MGTKASILLLAATLTGLVAPAAIAQTNESNATSESPLDPVIAAIAPLDTLVPNANVSIGSTGVEAEVVVDDIAAASADVPLSFDEPTLALAVDPLGALGVLGPLDPLGLLQGALAPSASSEPSPSVPPSAAATNATSSAPQVDGEDEPEPTYPSAWSVLPDPFHGNAWTGGAATGPATPLLASAASVDDAVPGPAVEEPAPEVPLPAPKSPLAESSTLAAVAIGVTAMIAAIASLYSRFQKHNLLRSQPRSLVHAHVLSRPGLTLPDLSLATGLSRGSLVHHCQMLEKHGLLVSRHDGLHRRFFPPGLAPEPAPRPPTRSEERLLEAIAQKGALTQRELARILDVSPQAVHQQVRRLELHGRIVVVREENGKRRYVTRGAGGR